MTWITAVYNQYKIYVSIWASWFILDCVLRTEVLINQGAPSSIWKVPEFMSCSGCRWAIHPAWIRVAKCIISFLGSQIKETHQRKPPAAAELMVRGIHQCSIAYTKSYIYHLWCPHMWILNMELVISSTPNLFCASRCQVLLPNL